MPRLFIAIDFPESVKQAAKTLKTDISGASWVNTGNIHLTLRFLGDMADEQVEPIKTALGEIKASPFEVKISGVGKFPQNEKKAPRVLWMGIVPKPELNHLQEQVESAMLKLGFPPGNPPFSPHITLARLKPPKSVRDVQAFLDKHHDFALSTFVVTEFFLYSSILSSQGAQYTHEARFSLSTQ